MRYRHVLTASVVGIFLVAAHGQAQEWGEFRGPHGGHAATANIPLKWSEQSNVTWKAAVPGQGHSSPVVADGRIWLTTAVVATLDEAAQQAQLSQLKNPRGLEIAGSLSLRAVCVDFATGEIKHDIELLAVDRPEPVHSQNSYASPTPVLSDGRLYCHFGTYGTACLDATTGRILWRQDTLHVDHQNGPGASPILWRDRLLIQYDGIDQQFVAALSTDDGRVLWRTPRSGKMSDRAEFQKAYCTPLVTASDGRELLISPGADWLYAYAPEDGREVWRTPYGKTGFSTVPRPVTGHGLVFVCTSFMQSRLLAVRLDGPDDDEQTRVAWQTDQQVPQKPSLLLVGQELYSVNDGGIAVCRDALTGEVLWRERLTGQYAASPLLAAGRIYFFNRDGKATVIAPGREFKKLAVNTLDDGFMASPAVFDDSLILRTTTHLYRIAE